MISQHGDTLHVDFSRWGLDAYKVFLQSKTLPECNLEYRWREDRYELRTPARFARVFGLEEQGTDHGFLPLHADLFDYEAFIVRMALKAKRFAVWADTGLGKTFMQLEFAVQVAHKTGGRVLIIAPLNIIDLETLPQAAFFYDYDLCGITRLETKAQLRQWCQAGPGHLAVVNPEKFIPRDGEPEIISELQHLRGVVLDESSILKTGGGVIKWALIKSCRGIEYKLSCTATPAPNDTMEYASQGSFLEKLRSEGEILWTFFTRDKEGNWKVKEHAREAFYRFMSGWSIYLRNPAAYGFEDNLKDLPKPVILEHVVPITEAQRRTITQAPDKTGQLPLMPQQDRVGITHRSKQSQVATGFIYAKDGAAQAVESNKPAIVAELVRREVTAGLQVLVWTIFDEETAILRESLADLAGLEVLSGSTPKKARLAIIERFRRGESLVLVSKASLLGYGLNFQNCGAMIFSGVNDSFEQFYQAVRRAYRYGQTRAVRIHIPIVRELEGVIWDNVKEKATRFEHDVAIQEANYRKAMGGLLQ
jgi:hypothetical protein